MKYNHLQKDSALIKAAKEAVEVDGGDVIIFAGAPLIRL